MKVRPGGIFRHWPCRDVANVNRRAPTIPHLLSSAQTANMSGQPWSSDQVSLLASMSLSLTPSSLQRSFPDPNVSCVMAGLHGMTRNQSQGRPLHCLSAKLSESCRSFWAPYRYTPGAYRQYRIFNSGPLQRSRTEYSILEMNFVLVMVATFHYDICSLLGKSSGAPSAAGAQHRAQDKYALQ